MAAKLTGWAGCYTDDDQFQDFYPTYYSATNKTDKQSILGVWVTEFKKQPGCISFEVTANFETALEKCLFAPPNLMDDQWRLVLGTINFFLPTSVLEQQRQTALTAALSHPSASNSTDELMRHQQLPPLEPLTLEILHKAIFMCAKWHEYTLGPNAWSSFLLKVADRLERDSRELRPVIDLLGPSWIYMLNKFAASYFSQIITPAMQESCIASRKGPPGPSMEEIDVHLVFRETTIRRKTLPPSLEKATVWPPSPAPPVEADSQHRDRHNRDRDNRRNRDREQQRSQRGRGRGRPMGRQADWEPFGQPPPNRPPPADVVTVTKPTGGIPNWPAGMPTGRAWRQMGFNHASGLLLRLGMPDNECLNYHMLGSCSREGGCRLNHNPTARINANEMQRVITELS
jgi:hypothetical protein